MYFWNYGLEKTWLDKCLENPVLEDPSRNNIVNGPKHCWICRAAPLSYLLISVKEIELKKIIS